MGVLHTKREERKTLRACINDGREKKESAIGNDKWNLNLEAICLVIETVSEKKKEKHVDWNKQNE